ncbi:MAG TPA: 50S ribosomal protein L18 [Candidatus Acidoferrales bacterium]|jgi:large subunit ribosomal protein L18|nr:50S ribosomal protein L18 [Candidatus Acidoferrales bacterium]
MRTQKKHQLQQLRRWRIRKKIVGSKDRPRMSVCFTSENIHVQFIDDEAGRTLAAVSTVGAKSAAKDLSANVNGAKAIGTMAAKNAIDKGIKEVVFDRGGKLYHGKVKALADAAREAGLKF